MKTFKELIKEVNKLTNAQQKQLEMLADGKWHTVYNDGIKGLKHQTLEALIKKGFVKMKKDVDMNRYKDVFGKYKMHSDRDLLFSIVKG